ncbi:MAG: LacI family DNA-binding transcriptional regulator [Oscillospiraceae bacterium]|nr:LacI family DNA-binding transcriptional regulator [Oscillospiraceae bacterium]
MVSMKDIAQRCDVSVATVSKALNGQPDIGSETRKKILLAADEMGYTANVMARALKTNRTYNLGILFEDLQNSGFMHEYFASTLNSFRTEAERCGYDITFINSDVGHTSASYLQHARYRRVEGVAIICADFFDPMVQELVNSDIPVVTLDHAFDDRMAVLSDNMNGVEELVRYVYNLGHRRIAYIHGNPTAVTDRRLRGFYRACETLGLVVPEAYVTGCSYHEPVGCYEATKRLLALPERPSCILFSDDYAYIGGINAITEAGLRVPEDISTVGYDGIHLNRVISPRLTTWQQNTEALGRTAAAMLIDKIERPRTASPEHLIIHGSLYEGESVRRLS